MSDPSWSEAAAALEAAEPAEIARPARTLVIDLVHVGAEWVAASSQLDAFAAYGDDREAAEKAAREKLAGWLDPAVRLEFRETGTRHPG
jgi:hypothetical protein